MATVTSEPDDLKTDLKEDKEDKVIIYLYSNYNHGLYSIMYTYVCLLASYFVHPVRGRYVRNASP